MTEDTLLDAELYGKSLTDACVEIHSKVEKWLVDNSNDGGLEGVEVCRQSANVCLRVRTTKYLRSQTAKNSLVQSGPDVRVARAMGPRGYAKVRISVISNSAKAASSVETGTVEEGAAWYNYSQPFQHRWTDLHLRSAIMDVVPGSPVNLSLGADGEVSVLLPKQGQGIRGVILADPCYDSRWIPCVYGDLFGIEERMPTILNAVFGAKNARAQQWSFWAMLGDNFYDRSGELTTYMWSMLSQEVKQTLFYTIIGNHDLWVFGFPELASQAWDQYGNGLLQFYGQDPVAALTSFPYNFSVDPSQVEDAGKRSPAPSNNVAYHTTGNVGFITYAGGSYEFSDYEQMFQEGCEFLYTEFSQKRISIVFLLEHWDVANTGCDEELTIQAVHQSLSSDKRFPGCNLLAQRETSLLRYFTGHEHCNEIKSGGDGFQTAGWGMIGCGNNGLPTLDTTDGRAIVRYFPFGQILDRGVVGAPAVPDYYDETLSCIESNGSLDKCYHLAETWLNISLPW